MKRKITSGRTGALDVAKLRPSPSDLDSSRFCSCPVCGKSVAKALINIHLDECLAAPFGRQRAAEGSHKYGDGGELAQGAGSLPIEACAAESLGGSDSTPVPTTEVQQQQVQPGNERAPADLLPKPDPSSAEQQQREQQEQQQSVTLGHEGQRGSLASRLGERTVPKVATAYLSGRQGAPKGKLSLTAEQLFGVAYSEIVTDFLPPQLAEEVVKELMRDRPLFTHGTWWIAGIEQKAPQSSHQYWLATEGEDPSTEDEYSGPAGRADSSSHPPQPPAALRQAASLVAAAVTQRVAAGRVAHLPLEAADRDGWHPSYCLANCYESGSQSVGWHTDKLLTLGPLPIIASLSLGATRSFQLHREQRLAVGLDGTGGAYNMGHVSSGGGERGDSSSSGAATMGRPAREGGGCRSSRDSRLSSAVAGSVERIDTPLPHNTLLIMWPPTQEAWKHRVPKTQAPYPHHPLAGATRYNLTFRRLKPHWEQQAPLCNCGQRAVLRAWQRQPQDSQQQIHRQQHHPQEQPLWRQLGQREPHNLEEGQQGREERPGGQRKAKQQQEGQEVEGARVVRYYYACDNMRGTAPCGFWQRGPVIEL
ncbi:hypothetical protein N2152v2_000760 [Parachlorella kessleri]